MSRDLVEALCQAMSAELHNPTDQQSELAELVEIARMRILVVRTLRAEGQIQQQRQLLLEQDRMSWAEGTCIELQSFADTAFLETQARASQRTVQGARYAGSVGINIRVNVLLLSQRLSCGVCGQQRATAGGSWSI